MTKLLNAVSPDTIALRLLSLPEEIAQAETSLHLLEERRRVAVEILQRSEDALLLDPERVNGKNAEQRAAQVRLETQTEREALSCAEYRATEAKISLRRLQNEHASLRAVARLLGDTG